MAWGVGWLGGGILIEAGTEHTHARTHAHIHTRAVSHSQAKRLKHVRPSAFPKYLSICAHPAPWIFKQITVRIMKITVLSDVMRRGLADRYQFFGATLGIHFHIAHCDLQIREVPTSAQFHYFVYHSYLAPTCFGLTATIKELTPYY